MSTNMKYLPLQIGDLTAQLPIIQGGMGVGVSLGGLAGAVAKAGGVGIISSAQIGFREPEFDKNPFEANKKAMHKEYQKAKEIAPEGIVGFNIMVALKHYKEYVTEAAEMGADLIISGAGLATELPAYVEGYGTKIAPIVSSAKSAQVLLKLWDRNYHRTADMLVIEGPQAGGHLGFRREEIEAYTEEAYEAVIQDIIQVVREYEEKYGHKIPVAAAGGIDNADKVRRMFEIGVDAVQVASRFVASYECDAHENFKQMYIDSEEKDIVLVSSPVGMPGRAVRNSFVREVLEGKKRAVKKCYGCLQKCNPEQIPYCITEALIRAVTGDTDNGLVFCGAQTYKIRKLETVKNIIESLLK